MGLLFPLPLNMAVKAARKDLDEMIAKVAKQKLFEGGVSLTNAQQKFRSGVTGSAGAALGRRQVHHRRHP